MIFVLYVQKKLIEVMIKKHNIKNDIIIQFYKYKTI